MAGIANIPRITTSNTTASYYDGTGTSTLGLVSSGTSTLGNPIFVGTAQGGNGSWTRSIFQEDHDPKRDYMIEAARQEMENRKQEKQVAKSTLRIVQVFIADPNDNVPLDDRMIYRGNQHLTDATDQELFFEININELLTAHNAKRVKIVDKSIKDRTEYLEPVKIRDLRMVVVNVATF